MKQKVKQKADRIQDKTEKVEKVPGITDNTLSRAESKLDKQIRFENKNPKGTLERFEFAFMSAFRGRHDDGQAWENIFMATGIFGGYILGTLMLFSINAWAGFLGWLVMTFFIAGLFQEARKEDDE